MAADDRPHGRLRRLAGTVRFRVTALATIAALVVLAAAGVGLVVAQRHLLTQNLDESMQLEAKSLEPAVVDGRTPDVLSGFGDDDTVAQVVAEGGRVVAATPNAAGLAPVAPGPTGGRQETIRTVERLPTEDAAYRLLARRVEGPVGPRVILIAASLGDVRESTRALIFPLVVAIPAAGALLAAVTWVLVGRTLRPVEAIRAEVADISGSALDRRVPEPASDDEIARLARTMNAMLDRVEGSVDRQHRFVADASHELRSPLTRIRSELEVDLAHPDRADVWATHRSVLEEAAGMQHLVENLLHLARSDAGFGVARRDLVDLDDIVLRAARGLRADGQVAADTKGVAAAQVRGDPTQLARAVGNLVDNAARHADSCVTFTVTENRSVAVVSVADDGPGIPPDQQERVFERFTRLDEARQGTTGGVGLGLAIARDVAVRHGGTLSVDGEHRGGARFVITLPLGIDRG